MKELIELYKSESSEVFNNIKTEVIQDFVKTIIDAYKYEQKILFVQMEEAFQLLKILL